MYSTLYSSLSSHVRTSKCVYVSVCSVLVCLCLHLHIYLSRERGWGFLKHAGPCDGHMQAPCAALSCKQELVTARTSLPASHFHPPLPLPLTLSTSRPVFLSLPCLARLRHRAWTRSQGTGCTLQRSHGLWCAFVTCTQYCSSSQSLVSYNQPLHHHHPQQQPQQQPQPLCACM